MQRLAGAAAGVFCLIVTSLPVAAAAAATDDGTLAALALALAPSAAAADYNAAQLMTSLPSCSLYASPAGSDTAASEREMWPREDLFCPHHSHRDGHDAMFHDSEHHHHD